VPARLRGDLSRNWRRSRPTPEPTPLGRAASVESSSAGDVTPLRRSPVAFSALLAEPDLLQEGDEVLRQVFFDDLPVFPPMINPSLGAELALLSVAEMG
jgi:hypothetical protein